ncbi:hypothetical protein C8R44DRAFT_818892 [Mycena epipterygia]|nr:hypothetical protein C8R44DRAFT_818892 [Mycena epipterygia]
MDLCSIANQSSRLYGFEHCDHLIDEMRLALVENPVLAKHTVWLHRAHHPLHLFRLRIRHFTVRIGELQKCVDPAEVELNERVRRRGVCLDLVECQWDLVHYFCHHLLHLNHVPHLLNGGKGVQGGAGAGKVDVRYFGCAACIRAWDAHPAAQDRNSGVDPGPVVHDDYSLVLRIHRLHSGNALLHEHGLGNLLCRECGQELDRGDEEDDFEVREAAVAVIYRDNFIPVNLRVNIFWRNYPKVSAHGEDVVRMRV